jgi:hypothetical protein
VERHNKTHASRCSTLSHVNSTDSESKEGGNEERDLGMQVPLCVLYVCRCDVCVDGTEWDEGGGDRRGWDSGGCV